MGYITRNNGEITSFWPDDTDTKMYVVSCLSHSISYLIDLARIRWPEASLDDIEISAEKIRTSCLYYDLYDSTDYTNFIILEYIK